MTIEEKAKGMQELFDRLPDKDGAAILTVLIGLQRHTHKIVEDTPEKACSPAAAIVAIQLITTALFEITAAMNKDLLRLTEQVATLTGRVAKYEKVEQNGTA